MYPIKRIVISVLVAAVLAFAWAACDAPDDNGGIGTSPSDPEPVEPTAAPDWVYDVGARCTCFRVARVPGGCPSCVMLSRRPDDGLNGAVFAGRCELAPCCLVIE